MEHQHPCRKYSAVDSAITVRYGFTRRPSAKSVNVRSWKKIWSATYSLF